MCGSDELPRLEVSQVRAGLEFVNARGLNVPFRQHRHDYYVIGITEAGVQNIRYRGAERHALPGQAFVLHPDELHDGRPNAGASYGYRAVYVAPELISDALNSCSIPFVDEVVNQDAILRRTLRQIFAAASSVDVDPLDCVVGLADALLQMSDDKHRSLVNEGKQLACRIRDHLRENAVIGFSASELEAEFELSRFAIYRLFRKHFAVSPSSYIQQRKSELARDAIDRGHSLADAALIGGFSDQAHMTRQFVRTLGVTPARWKSLTEMTAVRDKHSL